MSYYLGKRRAEKIVEALSDVMRTSKMKNCQFSLDEEDSMGSEKDTNKIRKATELWRKSWITSPLEEVIKELKGVYGL